MNIHEFHYIHTSKLGFQWFMNFMTKQLHGLSGNARGKFTKFFMQHTEGMQGAGE